MTHLGSALEIYDFIEQIGDGSFGTVHKAKHKISHKVVAVKVMKKKYDSINDCKDQFEPKLLHLMPPHKNIVQMYDSCYSTKGDLSFVMEFMDGGNLYQLMRERRQQHLPLSHCELQSIMHQMLSAVSHIHHHNIFHRDMKPENLLIDYSTGNPTIKLADFGLARELNSRPPYTEYVSTRWYRAPEVLLRSTEYSSAVDMWAVGTIFAELITLEPLFPGESEIDQICRICQILGSPGNKLVLGKKNQKLGGEKRLSPGFARKKIVQEKKEVSNSTLSSLDGGGEWKEGVKLAYKIGFQFPIHAPKPLETVVPCASQSMLDLLRHLLLFNPSYRWTADAALKHHFFQETKEPAHSVILMNIEPITPPDKHETLPIDRGLYSSKLHQPAITPFDLLPIPQSPHPVCPEWSSDYPTRLPSRSGSITTHIDRFLHEMDPPAESDWLAETRPIYSSHQKIHPVTDKPHSPACNKYRYASHQKQRLGTPIEKSKRQNSLEGDIRTRRTLDTVNTLSVSRYPTPFEHIPHYGHQLVKWSPPLVDPEIVRPPSRRRQKASSVPPVNWAHKKESHRLNLWVPLDDENEEIQENNGIVFLPLQ